MIIDNLALIYLSLPVIILFNHDLNCFHVIIKSFIIILSKINLACFCPQKDYILNFSLKFLHLVYLPIRLSILAIYLSACLSYFYLSIYPAISKTV